MGAGMMVHVNPTVSTYKDKKFLAEYLIYIIDFRVRPNVDLQIF